MATRGYLNNFQTTLDGSIDGSQTSIDVIDSTDIDTLLGTYDYCILTIDDGTDIEIIKVTASASNTLTVVRAQEGTSGTSFASGVKVQLRVTADSFASGATIDWTTITETTLTGSETEVTFTGLDGFYEIEFDQVSANHTSDPELQFYVSTDNGSTYSGTDYRYALIVISDNSGTVSGVVPGGTTYVPLWAGMYADNALFATNGKICTSDLGDTSHYKSFEVSLRQAQSGFGAISQYTTGVFTWKDSTAVNAIKIALSAGTFRSGGKVRLRKRSY